MPRQPKTGCDYDYYEPWDPHRPSLNVYEQEPRPSGLLDAQGRPLIQKKVPMGFHPAPKPSYRSI